MFVRKTRTYKVDEIDCRKESRKDLRCHTLVHYLCGEGGVVYPSTNAGLHSPMFQSCSCNLGFWSQWHWDLCKYRCFAGLFVRTVHLKSIMLSLKMLTIKLWTICSYFRITPQNNMMSIMCEVTWAGRQQFKVSRWELILRELHQAARSQFH
jgi:hypothetical protein